MKFKPRPKQTEVLAYRQGKMGVSSVPGGGKTLTLSYLAAEIVSAGVLEPGQEVLIVTLVNSAVENFSNRLGGFVSSRGLLPGVGYRVRTLHGLAHDIVRERPELTGLADNFQIIDELAAERITSEVIDAWIRGHPQFLEQFLIPDPSERDLRRIRHYGWPALVRSVGTSLIRQAKDSRLAPADLRERLDQSVQDYPLLEMAASIFEDYQRALSFRGAVDFDDLIGKALDALESDPDYLGRLRHRWPYVLEDEAQDSSQLQEEILRTLVGEQGNWVRMGDTNQAIFESFTTASPEYLRTFLEKPGVQARELPNSGRSTLSILRLANRLVEWSRTDHPVPELRGTLTLPHIEPAPSGDPQPNPEGGKVQIVPNAYTPDEEVRAVATSLSRWLPDHQGSTVAVLVPTNHLGVDYADEFRKHSIKHLEFLRSTRATRRAAGYLGGLLSYLARPDSTRDLISAYRIWGSTREERAEFAKQGVAALRKVGRIERFLWPRAGEDWLATDKGLRKHEALREHLGDFRTQVQYWQAATELPSDQLVLTLGHDLFLEPADLALAYKLSGVVRRASRNNPQWGLAELAGELDNVARNQRRFLGLSADDRGFNADSHPGEVVIATIHKAKGLEWDRVHLVSVNSYDYPSAEEGDQFIAEKWFVKDGLNLQAEALHQMRALFKGSSKVDSATVEARREYAAERLRLLYVGITRARRELILTWNMGRRGDQRMATPLAALSERVK
ncbi:MAG: ATP-dependent helicase [Anaerolineales bacterium]